MVAKGLPIKGNTFSLNQKADYYASNIVEQNSGYKFDFHTPSKIYKNIQFNLIGLHNLSNAIAASAMIDLAEIPLNDALNSLKYFKGLKRRIEIFEIVGKIIVDDYAHHPIEIDSVFNAIKERYSNKRICFKNFFFIIEFTLVNFIDFIIFGCKVNIFLRSINYHSIFFF